MARKREAVIAACSRTALAKSFRGSFCNTRPEDLAAHCIKHVLGQAAPVDPSEIEDVILGCAQPYGPQGMNIGRRAALLAGLPDTVPGATINRFCASGLQAIVMAAHQVLFEGADAVIAGGVESISLSPRDSSPHQYLAARHPGLYMEMGVTAEVVAKRYAVSRQAQDEYALTSQQRIARAQAEGFFETEIAPFTAEGVDCRRDECNRPNTTLAGLAALKPVFDADSGEGSVTAGNSSQLSDGAAVALVLSRARADQLGVPYALIYRGFAVAGCAPDEMGIGPVFAVPKLLRRHALQVADIDLWELNEAFAAQTVYCRDRIGIPMERLNVNGGAISIGHPFGMTGARLVGTLANQMTRMPDARYGVVTMCVGGGQGAAALFESKVEL